jgi:triacylglycerol lipase
MRHHVYFSPGMFGFGSLGSYTYFAHVERALVARFATAGHELIGHVIEDLPTASIRRRATRLAEVVQRTAPPSDAIHLLGHSTGGLDARLVASPATRSIAVEMLGWLPRLRSVTTMNTPHYGTPLASFFATSKGQRVLGALSMLTFAGLTLGATPLRATSLTLGFLRPGDLALPFKLQMLDRAVESVVGTIDDAGSPEVRVFLAAIRDDQGSMMQLSPEAMDLVVASFED